METVDIIYDVVNAINKKIIIDSIVDNLDGTYTISTENTKWCQETFKINIGGNDYKVLIVDKDKEIVVSGATLPTGTSFDLYEPTYYHGTVINVNKEMKMGANAHNLYSRTPFIYLKELLKDSYNSSYNDSPIEKESDLVILFLTQCKYQDWNTIDHYSKSIAPMRALVEGFLSSLRKNINVGKFQAYDIINHVNFGVYTTDKGNTKSIFNEHLSGCELNIKIPITRQKNCLTY